MVTQYLEATALPLGQLEVLCTGDELTVVAAEGTGCELAGRSAVATTMNCRLPRSKGTQYVGLLALH